VAARLAVGLYCDPIRVRVINALVRGVWIDARHHVHTKPAARREHFAERVAAREEFAAIVQRDLGRIEGHATARTEACAIGVDPLEVVQPEGLIVAARVVFHEGKLNPSHGPVEPARSGLLAERGSDRRQGSRLDHPFAPIDFHRRVPPRHGS